MQAPDLLRLALTGLFRNKLRSGLTSLGVTVGVFALTTIISVGQGLERSIVVQLTDNESRSRIIVSPGYGKVEDIEGVDDPEKADRLRKARSKRLKGGPRQMKRTRLTVKAIEEFQEEYPEILEIRPLTMDRFEVTFEDRPAEVVLSYGVDPSIDHWNKRVLAGDRLDATREGVWLHEYLLYTWGFKSDEEQAALIGKTLLISRPSGASTGADGKTRRQSPIDRLRMQIPMARMALQMLPPGMTGDMDMVRVDKALAILQEELDKTKGKDGPSTTREVRIAGVIRERIEEDGFEVWEDSFSMQADMFFPQEFAEELFLAESGNVDRGYNVVAIEVDEPDNVAKVEKGIRDKGFRALSIETILKRVGKAMAIVTAVVSGLTAIALLVAMLGIVNTMVMNVTERTREIGVLKALGATDRQVRGLFLVESALIGLAGGVLGIGLSLLASIPGDLYVREAIYESSKYRWDGSVFHYPWWLIALGLAFAVGLSVLAALGPATRASRVDPVMALRDE